MPREREPREAKQQGLPVDLLDIVKDAVALASQGGTIGLANRAPHPNAASVFVNWLLSREGQMVAQKALAQRGVAVEKRALGLEEPIKALGIYELPVHLHPAVTATLKLWVVKA